MTFLRDPSYRYEQMIYEQPVRTAQRVADGRI
jgi:hypothetical protein